MTDEQTDPPTRSTAVARYDGPRDIESLTTYSHLLAGRENPNGVANVVLPAQYRGNPGAIAFAVEYARALDVSPVTALTGIHVIDGKPTASAGLISALVRRAGHKLRVKITGTYETNDLEAVATLVRHDDPEPYESRWDLRRAVRAELLRWDGDANRYRAVKSRSAWDTYPENMLKARAITEVARDAAEDVLLGVHYTPEELGADVDAATGEVVHTVTSVPTAQDAPAQARKAAERDAGELVDRLRSEILAAGDVETLLAVWRRYRLDQDQARAIELADDQGEIVTAYDLFARIGRRLSGTDTDGDQDGDDGSAGTPAEPSGPSGDDTPGHAELSAQETAGDVDPDPWATAEAQEAAKREEQARARYNAKLGRLEPGDRDALLVELRRRSLHPVNDRTEVEPLVDDLLAYALERRRTPPTEAEAVARVEDTLGGKVIDEQAHTTAEARHEAMIANRRAEEAARAAAVAEDREERAREHAPHVDGRPSKRESQAAARAALRAHRTPTPA